MRSALIQLVSFKLNFKRGVSFSPNRTGAVRFRLLFCVFPGLLSACSGAPPSDSNQSRILLTIVDNSRDITAKVSKVVDANGSSVTINEKNYGDNFVTVATGRYTVFADCFKEIDHGIYPHGSTRGTFDLRSGEFLRLKFIPGTALVKHQQCDVLFSTNK